MKYLILLISCVSFSTLFSQQSIDYEFNKEIIKAVKKGIKKYEKLYNKRFKNEDLLIKLSSLSLEYTSLLLMKIENALDKYLAKNSTRFLVVNKHSKIW